MALWPVDRSIHRWATSRVYALNCTNGTQSESCLMHRQASPSRNTSPTLAHHTIQSGDVDPRRLRHPWKWGQFRVVPGLRDGVFRWIRTVPDLARPIPTFSTVAAADQKCGPWCVLGWKPTGWTSGCRHTLRKHVWNIKNHGDGHALGPTIAALMNIQSHE